MKTDKIYLVGFMGAGKTTLAKALGARLAWPAVDIDELIERREHRTIADIFAREGEPYFRRVEREVLHGQLPQRTTVVATGGGTFVDPDNRAVICRDGAAVWLDVPLPRIIDRLPHDGRRPLAADRAQLERLYEARKLAYQQAHVRLDAARAPIPALVEQLLEWLES